MGKIEFSAVAIKPYTVIDGVMNVEHDASPELWAVRRRWRGEDGKMRSTFVAELHVAVHGERAERLAAAMADAANGVAPTTTQQEG